MFHNSFIKTVFINFKYYTHV